MKKKNSKKSLTRTRDLTYIKMIEDVSHDIEPHIKIISNSKGGSDAELHGRVLKEDMQKQINNSQYQISPELKPLEIKFKKCLEDYYNVGKFIEMGIKNNDSNSINNALSYANDGYSIMEDMSKFIEDYMKKNNIQKR